MHIDVHGAVVAKQTADIDLGKVHYFGELAILEGKDAKRGATVRVSSPAATVSYVSTKAIEDAFGSLKDLLTEQGTDAMKLTQESFNKKSKKTEEFAALGCIDVGEQKARGDGDGDAALMKKYMKKGREQEKANKPPPKEKKKRASSG